MRFLLALIGLAAVVVIGMMAFGFLTIQGTPGSLPQVKMEGGSAPQVNANVAHVTFGTETKTVDVPTVTTTTKTVTVPTLNVSKPGQPTPASTAPAQ